MPFPWKERRKEKIFLLSIKIYLINWYEKTWATLLENDLDLKLPFKKETPLGLDNPCWTRKIPKLCYKQH